MHLLVSTQNMLWPRLERFIIKQMREIYLVAIDNTCHRKKIWKIYLYTPCTYIAHYGQEKTKKKLVKQTFSSTKAKLFSSFNHLFTLLTHLLLFIELSLNTEKPCFCIVKCKLLMTTEWKYSSFTVYMETSWLVLFLLFFFIFFIKINTNLDKSLILHTYNVATIFLFSLSLTLMALWLNVSSHKLIQRKIYLYRVQFYISQIENKKIKHLWHANEWIVQSYMEADEYWFLFRGVLHATLYTTGS